jgi:hypothetical protein
LPDAVPVPLPHTPLRFLRALWPDADRGFLVLWWREDRHTEFVPISDLEARVPLLLERRGNVNVYFGMGLQAAALGRNGQRGSEVTVTAIPGLWADVDTAVGHSGANGKVYAPTKEDARLLIEAMPAPATWVIDSGNGLHAYWQFREPLVFASTEERLEAKRLVKGWEVLLRREAGRRGWTVDSAHDLARVMRLPDTVNRKDGLPDQHCTILLNLPPVLNPGDVEQWIPEGVSVEPTTSGDLPGGDFTVCNQAAIPDLVDVLASNDQRFARTWRGERSDLHDQSPSGYELSLTSQVINSRLVVDNQQLMDMCAAWRRKHATSKRPTDKGVRYYADLFRRARAREGRRDGDVVREAVRAQDEADHVERVVAAREEGRELDLIRRELPLDSVERIIKRGRTDARYYLVIGGEEIAVGTLTDLTNWRKFRATLGDQIKRLVGPSRRRADEWDRLVDLALQIAEEQDYGPDGSENEVLLTLLEEYVTIFLPRPRPGEPTDHRRHAVPHLKPWVNGGILGVHRGHFASWLEGREHRQRPSQEVRSFLRGTLGPSEQVNAVPLRGGKGVNRHYYCGPAPAWAAVEPDESAAEEGAPE